jgi:hypothetical protein
VRSSTRTTSYCVAGCFCCGQPSKRQGAGGAPSAVKGANSDAKAKLGSASSAAHSHLTQRPTALSDQS